MKLVSSLILMSSILFLKEALAAEIVAVNPAGAVKNVQQVRAQFSTDMVAMGDPRSLSDPFKLVCNVKAKQEQLEGEEEGSSAAKKGETPVFKTRWADSKNWVLDFDKPLKSGMSCDLTLKSSELRDLKGDAVSGLEKYSFSTGGPNILSYSPQYASIEPDQYFVLRGDGPFDNKSVEEKAYFEVEGAPDKVKVKVIAGKDRDAVLAAAVRNNWQWSSLQDLLKVRKKPASQIREFENFLVVGASRRFPEKANVVLHWPNGILSKSGVAVTEAQEFTFQVVEEFAARFTCDRVAPERPCNPILSMRVDFTRPVPVNSLKGAVLEAKGAPARIPNELNPQKTKEKIEFLSSLTFEGPFPEKSSFRVLLPKGLKDELGRKLSNQAKFPLDVGTDEYSPLVKFAAAFGVLESKADPALPVSLRNVESPLMAQQKEIAGKSIRISSLAQAREVLDWYKKVVEKEENYYDKRNTSLLGSTGAKNFQLPKPNGAREFELVGIPLKEPGFHVVELASPKLGAALTEKKGTMFVTAAALVTDLGIHLKKGRESSLVWVTRLSNAQAVADAHVVIMTGKGVELAKGKTDANGIFRTGPLKGVCKSDAEDGESGGDCEIYAFAQKDEQFTFVSSAWQKGIETYRFNVSTEYLDQQWGPVVTHTVVDRALAKTGDVIHMKHFLREHTAQGFAMLDSKKVPKRVLIVHRGSRKTYTIPFEFDAKTGTAVGEFRIPKDATLGRYSIYLSNKGKLEKDESDEGDPFDWNAQETGHFIVSDYRLPLMKTTVKVLGEPLVRPSQVKVDLSASYLSGGPAQGLKAKVRATMQPASFEPDVPGASEFTFFSMPLKAGTQTSEERVPPEEKFLRVQDISLNGEGGAVAVLKDLPSVRRIQQLQVEMEYVDPNGEVKTAATDVPVYPSQAIVGIRSETWFTSSSSAKVQGIITDPKGKILANQDYAVDAYRTEYVTHRKRLVGGFYSYDSKYNISAIGQVCKGKTDELGRFTCEPKNLGTGRVTLQAKTQDKKGFPTYANVDIDLFEEGKLSWWVPSDSDRIDLLPERTRYEPGQKAKFVIRTPYPVATALVTVEREGVLEAFVVEVKRDNPVIEVPIRPHYAPNIFVSALLIRGRVGDPQASALLDLARPVMKMGLADLKVDWKSHELQVEVKPEKKTLHPREKLKATIAVKDAQGKAVTNGEVAVAVVDESLMRLKENDSWKILKAMMGARPLAVQTSSMQNQVVGRRHFGSKAKAPGGGGGQAENPREIFEPVLLWLPRLKLDAKGEAQFQVTMNDSMTSFRLVAVAQSGAGHFGDGKANVESTKDLILMSGFAPLVREEDRLKNVFTVRNATMKPMKVAVSASSPQVKDLAKIPDFELKPSEAKALTIPIVVPSGLKEMSIQLSAKDSLSGATDQVISKILVEPSVPEKTMQATLFQLDKGHQIPVKQPADGLPGRGGLRIDAKATLASGLVGVRSYMGDYPYSCLEQKVSKAIALEDKDATKRLIEEMPSYFDEAGLLKFFPTSICGSAQLSRYVLDILHENSYELPQATREKAIAGLRASLEGKAVCRNWWADLLKREDRTEENILVMEALARYGALKTADLGMIRVTPNLWSTETLVAWLRVLKAMPEAPNRGENLKQAQSILKSRVNFQGTLLSLQEDLIGEKSWRLMTTQDQQVIGVLNWAIEDSGWEGDVGRLARGVVARLRQGHWDTTTSNAWGVSTFRKFSAKFEKEKVAGATKVSAGEQKAEIAWSKSSQGGRTDLAWPANSAKQNVNVGFLQEGSGKPWVSLETRSAIPLKGSLDLGYRITRKIAPVAQQTAGVWRVGDVANIELVVTAKNDQPWVVVRDPVPAGASHLGTGLEGSSKILDRAPRAKSDGNELWPTEFEEKSFAGFTAYAGYLPKGSYKLNYRIRLNSAGEFKLPPTHVEAMYAPETFGESANAVWKVEP